MPDDDRVSALRATAHPLRLQMLSLLTQNPMSAAEVARELGLTHANASYHLRLLHDAGELVVHGEESIRGGRAKRYRYPHERGGEHPSPGRTSDADRVAHARAVGVELERRLLARRRGVRGTHSDLEGWVDPATWDRARALLEEAAALLHEANHPPRTEGTVHVSFTTWGFEMDRPGPREAP